MNIDSMNPPPKIHYHCHLRSCVPKFNHQQNGPESKHDKPGGYHIGEYRINPRIFLLTRYRKLFSEPTIRTHRIQHVNKTISSSGVQVTPNKSVRRYCTIMRYMQRNAQLLNITNLFFLAHHRKPHVPTTRQVVPISLHSNVQTGTHTAARPSFYPRERFNLLTCTNKSKTSHSHPQGVIIHSGKKAKQIMSGYVYQKNQMNSCVSQKYCHFKELGLVQKLTKFQFMQLNKLQQISLSAGNSSTSF